MHREGSGAAAAAHSQPLERGVGPQGAEIPSHGGACGTTPGPAPMAGRACASTGACEGLFACAHASCSVRAAAEKVAAAIGGARADAGAVHDTSRDDALLRVLAASGC